MTEMMGITTGKEGIVGETICIGIQLSMGVFVLIGHNRIILTRYFEQGGLVLSSRFISLVN